MIRSSAINFCTAVIAAIVGGRSLTLRPTVLSLNTSLKNDNVINLINSITLLIYLHVRDTKVSPTSSTSPPALSIREMEFCFRARNILKQIKKGHRNHVLPFISPGIYFWLTITSVKLYIYFEGIWWNQIFYTLFYIGNVISLPNFQKFMPKCNLEKIVISRSL